MYILISPSFSKTLSGTQARIFTWWDNDIFFLNPYMKWILNIILFFPHIIKNCYIFSQLKTFYVFAHVAHLWRNFLNCRLTMAWMLRKKIPFFFFFPPNKFSLWKLVFPESLEGILSYDFLSAPFETPPSYGNCGRWQIEGSKCN